MDSSSICKSRKYYPVEYAYPFVQEPMVVMETYYISRSSIANVARYKNAVRNNAISCLRISTVTNEPIQKGNPAFIYNDTDKDVEVYAADLNAPYDSPSDSNLKYKKFEIKSGELLGQGYQLDSNDYLIQFDCFYID